MELLFITGNKGKLEEIAAFLKSSGIELVHKHLDLVEPRSESLSEIAKEKAKDALKTVNEPFIVDDSGLFIDCLNGFPGTNSNWVFKKIGYPGILKLLEGKKDRKCAFKCAIALSIPGKEVVVFEGEELGTIAEDARGLSVFGYDPIFIPEADTKSCLAASFLNRRFKSLEQRSCERISSFAGKTWGEVPEVKNIRSHRQQAIEKLVKWLKENPHALK